MTSFVFIYFTINGAKKIVRETEDFVIERFHCNETSECNRTQYYQG